MPEIVLSSENQSKSTKKPLQQVHFGNLGHLLKLTVGRLELKIIDFGYSLKVNPRLMRRGVTFFEQFFQFGELAFFHVVAVLIVGEPAAANIFTVFIKGVYYYIR